MKKMFIKPLRNEKDANSACTNVVLFFVSAMVSDKDLEWKLTYVGSAESTAYDQILDTVVVGPVPVGKHKFVFQADHPEPEKIPVADAVGVTAVLLTCTYKDQEFVRVGYFVNNEYTDPELKDNPPTTPQYDQVSRTCLLNDTLFE